MEKNRGSNDGQKDFQKAEREGPGLVCVVPASMYVLGTVALSEQQQRRLQVCKNNWIRRIVGEKRLERRRMKDMREEVGTKASIVGKIVKSRTKWDFRIKRWEISEKSRDKGTRRLQKTRKTTAKMGGLCEERYKKGRGGRKVERKGQQQRAMEANHESSHTAE